MVVVAILGILAVTAVPFYQTFQQRAYGSQAEIIMKSLVNGQIIYYLENEKFFPPEGMGDIFIPYEGQGTPSPEGVLGDIEEKLKVKISQSPNLDYTIQNLGELGVGVTIRAPFRLFKDGGNPGTLTAVVSKDGHVDYVR